MRLVCISDTHRTEPALPDGDVLIHAGDGTYRGERHELRAWWYYLQRQPHKHKIVIAGNHDISLDECMGRGDSLYWEHVVRNDYGLTYLRESEVTIDGIRFWGSPVQPHFYNWAFQKARGDELARHWAQIPDNLDVLITHGPPKGFGDVNAHDSRIGDEDLLNRVLQVRPRFHIYGHAHHGYGVREFNNITFVNCSVLNEDYVLVNKPIVLDL